MLCWYSLENTDYLGSENSWQQENKDTLLFEPNLSCLLQNLAVLITGTESNRTDGFIFYRPVYK